MLPEITAYMPAANGGRTRTFKLDGITVTVAACEDDMQGEALAEFLASASDVIDGLRREVSSLRASVPPAAPVRLLGPGCVRFRGREMWLLNRASSGWASFGVRVDGWDDLFRRYDVRVVGRDRDETGEFWTVESSAGGSNV